MRRRRFVVRMIVAYSLAVATVLTLAVLNHQQLPRMEKATRLTTGMTRAGVYAAMGGPPGDYRRLVHFPVPHSGGTDLADAWLFDTETVYVIFTPGFTPSDVVQCIWIAHRRGSGTPRRHVWDDVEKWVTNRRP